MNKFFWNLLEIYTHRQIRLSTRCTMPLHVKSYYHCYIILSNIKIGIDDRKIIVEK